MHNHHRRLRPSRIKRPTRVRSAVALAIGLATIHTALTTAAAPAFADTAEAGSATSNQTAGLVYSGTSADNNVHVTLVGGSFTVDDVVPIQAGTGCAQVAGDATTVTCVAPKKRITVFARSGDDIVVNKTSAGAEMNAIGSYGDDQLFGANGVRDTLDGGSGNDTLHGLGGDDDLRGSHDNDRLYGGSSSDKLDGGAGFDSLDGGDGGDLLDGGLDTVKDVIDGGLEDTPSWTGDDRVSYASRSNPVTVDLAHPNLPQGEEGERDAILRVEAVSGGAGNDTLSGNAAGNSLDGNGGNDIISGEAGKDSLSGGDGDDALFPSSGVYGAAPDGEADIMDCGFIGQSDGEPSDTAFRVLADDDFVIDCATVIDQ
jgi:serralysin